MRLAPELFGSCRLFVPRTKMVGVGRSGEHVQQPEDESGLRTRYAALARSVEPDLLRHALRLCNGDLDWAKDLTQDALIAGYVVAREGKLEQGAGVRCWFVRVVTNRFINEYNRKKRWIADVDTDKLEDHPSGSEPSPTAEEAICADTLDEPLAAAVMQLPEEQRLCVLLVDVGELTYAEAAELLRTPVGTVRSRLARGRLKLYSLLLPYARSRRIV